VVKLCALSVWLKIGQKTEPEAIDTLNEAHRVCVSAMRSQVFAIITATEAEARKDWGKAKDRNYNCDRPTNQQ
jgi:hypothetical protein